MFDQKPCSNTSQWKLIHVTAFDTSPYKRPTTEFCMNSNSILNLLFKTHTYSTKSYITYKVTVHHVHQSAVMPITKLTSKVEYSAPRQHDHNSGAVNTAQTTAIICTLLPVSSAIKFESLSRMNLTFTYLAHSLTQSIRNLTTWILIDQLWYLLILDPLPIPRYYHPLYPSLMISCLTPSVMMAFSPCSSLFFSR